VQLVAEAAAPDQQERRLAAHLVAVDVGQVAERLAVGVDHGQLAPGVQVRG